MEKAQAKYMKERIEHETSKGQHERDMFNIDLSMDNILQALNEELMWNNLIPIKDDQLQYIHKVIKQVKEITNRNQ